jgi:hypothetical protein
MPFKSTFCTNLGLNRTGTMEVSKEKTGDELDDLMKKRKGEERDSSVANGDSSPIRGAFPEKPPLIVDVADDAEGKPPLKGRWRIAPERSLAIPKYRDICMKHSKKRFFHCWQKKIMRAF